MLCLVRARSEQDAYEKLCHGLKQYEIFDPKLMQRVSIICGDLSSSRFGLAVEQFDRLVKDVDAIYHNGAMVNFMQPYAALKAANVSGTQEVLRLACAYKNKPVHYILPYRSLGQVNY